MHQSFFCSPWKIIRSDNEKQALPEQQHQLIKRLSQSMSPGARLSASQSCSQSDAIKLHMNSVLQQQQNTAQSQQYLSYDRFIPSKINSKLFSLRLDCNTNAYANGTQIPSFQGSSAIERLPDFNNNAIFDGNEFLNQQDSYFQSQATNIQGIEQLQQDAQVQNHQYQTSMFIHRRNSGGGSSLSNNNNDSLARPQSVTQDQELQNQNINEILREDQNINNYSNLLAANILLSSEDERGCFYRQFAQPPSPSMSTHDLFPMNYQSQIENNASLFSQSHAKLLNYRNKITKLKRRNSNTMLDYNQIPRSQGILITDMRNQKYIRKIPKQPFKILDAPRLQDDYYLNLIDWSFTNLIAIGLENIVYTWNAKNNKALKIASLAENELITSVNFNAEGKYLAIGESTGQVKIFDIEKQKVLRRTTSHNSRVATLAWNNHLITSGSRDKEIICSDIRDHLQFNFKFTGHKQEVCGLKWSPDENILASGGNDNKVILWNLKMQSEIIKFGLHSAAVKALAWSPHQNNLLATGGGSTDKTIKFWNTQTLKLLKSIETGSQVCNMLFNKNVNELVTTHGYSLNQIAVWQVPTMQKIATLSGHSTRVLYLAGSPDGQNIVTGAGDETLRFWSVFPPTSGESAFSKNAAFSYELR